MEGTKIVDNTSYTLRKSEVARCEPALNSVETPKIMGRNPRTTISLKMKEKELSNESEASENSSSDEPKSPQNEATNYEKQRQLRIAQNKARMEAMGLRKTADSLINLVGKRKSKKAVKNGRKDDDYEPNNDDDDLKDDSSDSKCSSEELEEKKRKKKKKKKKERANVTSSGSQKALYGWLTQEARIVNRLNCIAMQQGSCPSAPLFDANVKQKTNAANYCGLLLSVCQAAN